MVWTDYKNFYTIRRTEETLLDLYSQGMLQGTVHTCIGQEPVALGVIGALDPDKDVVWSNHRGHGHYLAYSDDVEGLIAEVMGRSTGVCGGIGGSQHLHTGNFYTNGVLGGTVACAVGSGLAEKARGEGAVACVFFGDGALGEGVVYESFNLAALWKLPVLFVLEHNGIAQTTKTGVAHAGEIRTRANTFNIEVEFVTANEVQEVRAQASMCVDKVRRNSEPALLFVDTIRLGPHSKGDDTRTKNELEILSAKDPLLRIARQVAARDAARKMEIEESVETRLLSAVEAAVEAPFLNGMGSG